MKLIYTLLAAIGNRLHMLLFAHMARTGMIAFDDDPTAIIKSLDKIRESVKEVGEKAMAEAAKGIRMSAAEKERVDEMLVKHTELQTNLTDVTQRLEKQEKARTQGAEAKKSLGEMFVESDAFKKGMEGGVAQGQRISVNVKNITSLSASAGQGVAPDFRGDIISLGRRKFTIRDLMSPGTTKSNAVTYVKETGFTNSAAPVSETVKKPQSDIVLTAVLQAVITLAHYIKASVQILDDIPQLQSYIDGRLRYGLNFVEETQLLKGSGTGLNLNGIYTQATAYAAPISVASPTRVDVIRLMMLQAFLAEFPPTGIVLHPSDWAAIELGKDTQGRYIIGDPQGVLGANLWGLPVVETQAMTVNTGLVGAFKPMSQIFDREDASVVISTENEDDFVRNMITIRAEERLASAVYRPEAFVKNAALQ